MKSFLVIIITYNPQIDLLENSIVPDCEYLIIDNTETPFSSEILASKKNVKIIFNNKNLGIAKALNIGASFAIKSGYEWIVTMDQDSHISQPFIQKMENFISNSGNFKKLAVISPVHILQENIKIKVKKSLSGFEYRETIQTMTSGNFINLDIWKKINGFDEKLFIDMVDMDYYCRCVINGYKVIVLNNVFLKHYLGKLAKKIVLGKTFKVMNHNYIRKYYQFRNGLYVYFKYRQKVPEIKYVVKFLFGTLITTIFLEKHRILKIKYIILGIRDFLKKEYNRILD